MSMLSLVAAALLLLATRVLFFSINVGKVHSFAPSRVILHHVHGYDVINNLQPFKISANELPRTKEKEIASDRFALNVSNENDPTPTIRKQRPSLSIPLKVGGFYGFLGVVLWSCVRQQFVTPKEATVVCSLLWMGFVLAISFTESWVKFRAPFLPRHYGLDVGRTVFPVLNAVEVALAGILWLIQFTTSPEQSSPRFWSLLASLSLILFSQVCFLTPQLVLLGKRVIYDAFPNCDPTWSAKQTEAYEEICREVKGKPRPSSKLHIVYVVQEFIKILLIAKLVLNCR